MENKNFSYQVKVNLAATPEELDNMIECSQNHYDSVCREASAVAGQEGAPGNGFLTVWKRFHMDSTQELTTRELDTLCKIMESPGRKYGLYEKLRQILRDANDRWCELAGKPKVAQGPIRHPLVEAELDRWKREKKL